MTSHADTIRHALDSADTVIDKRKFRQTAVRIADALAALAALEADLAQAEQDRDNGIAAFNEACAETDKFEARLVAAEADLAQDALERAEFVRMAEEVAAERLQRAESAEARLVAAEADLAQAKAVAKEHESAAMEFCAAADAAEAALSQARQALEQARGLADAVTAWDAALSDLCDGPERDAVRAALAGVRAGADDFDPSPTAHLQGRGAVRDGDTPPVSAGDTPEEQTP